MLLRLSISNLVLIREAGLDFDPGLNAITGETGAGKTILSNAIGLLLGARGDAALLGAAGDEAYGPRARTGSCSRGASFPTAARAPMRGVVLRRAKTWRLRRSS
jgi:DNA repair protein RecN (Recombination protein N)